MPIAGFRRTNQIVVEKARPLDALVVSDVADAAHTRFDALDELADELGGTAVVCDLLDLEQARAVPDQVAAVLGPPEVLVNAAGTLTETASQVAKVARASTMTAGTKTALMRSASRCIRRRSTLW